MSKWCSSMSLQSLLWCRVWWQWKSLEWDICMQNYSWLITNVFVVSQLWRINSNIDLQVLSRTLVLDTYRPEICVTGSTGIIEWMSKWCSSMSLQSLLWCRVWWQWKSLEWDICMQNYSWLITNVFDNQTSATCHFHSCLLLPIVGFMVHDPFQGVDYLNFVENSEMNILIPPWLLIMWMKYHHRPRVISITILGHNRLRTDAWLASTTFKWYLSIHVRKICISTWIQNYCQM